MWNACTVSHLGAQDWTHSSVKRATDGHKANLNGEFHGVFPGMTHHLYNFGLRDETLSLNAQFHSTIS